MNTGKPIAQKIEKFYKIFSEILKTDTNDYDELGLKHKAFFIFVKFVQRFSRKIFLAKTANFSSCPRICSYRTPIFVKICDVCENTKTNIFV